MTGVFSAMAAKRVSPKQDLPARATARNTNIATARNTNVATARNAEISEAARNYAPRGIAALLAPVVRPAFRKRAPAAAQLLADWQSLAGPDLAAMAAPVKFSGGTLILACTGPTAMELQHAAVAIISRLNLGLGNAMVERLRFVQQTPGIAAPAVKTPPRAPLAPPKNLPDGPLGEALAKLYQGIGEKN
jgi:hypothetical protein